MPEPPRNAFQYSIVRVLPRVERGESLNVGVVLLCRPMRFLGARIALDEKRLAAFAPDLDPATIRPHLEAIERIAAGDPLAGPIATLGQAERFHWLVSPRARSSSRPRSTPGCATTRQPNSTTSSRRWSTSGRRARPCAAQGAATTLTQRSGGLVVEGDLDEWGVAGHRLDVLVGPDLDDLGEDRAPLRVVDDDPGGRRKVRRDPALEVEREPWLGFEVAQPCAGPLRRQATR